MNAHIYCLTSNMLCYLQNKVLKDNYNLNYTFKKNENTFFFPPCNINVLVPKILSKKNQRHNICVPQAQ